MRLAGGMRGQAFILAFHCGNLPHATTTFRMSQVVVATCHTLPFDYRHLCAHSIVHANSRCWTPITADIHFNIVSRCFPQETGLPKRMGMANEHKPSCSHFHPSEIGVFKRGFP